MSPEAENTRAPTARRALLAAAASLAALVLADVALGLLFVRDGTFRGKPLPPYGSLLTAGQRAQLAERRAALERGETVAMSPFDAELGWVNRPTPTGDGALDGFNSIGARGRREYDPSPAPGILRLVGFGDSFMHGAQVGWKDSWQAQLEELEPDWEAVNLGVNGYGTDQALLRFRRQGPALGAHVVCIGLMLENVARNVNRYKPLLHPANTLPLAKPRFVLEGAALELVPVPFASEGELLDAVESGRAAALLGEHEFWADPPLPGILWRSNLVRFAQARAGAGRRDHRRLWLDVEGEPRRVTLAILEAFHREALAGGARAAPVVIWPPEKDLRGYIAGDHYWSGLLEELESRGIPFVDLAAPLAEAAGLEAATAPLYSGWHLSRAGNGVVARALRAWVTAELER